VRLCSRWSADTHFLADSTETAAETAWTAIQAFYAGLPHFAPAVTSKTFHLATESYGGHWGPVFMNHFHDQNSLIAAGNSSGVELDLSSLTIINGLIDTRTQAPWYPRFARNNTHGVEVNDTVADFMEFSLRQEGNGCLDMIDICEIFYSADNGTTGPSRLSCSEASTVCRRGAELPYLAYAGVEDAYDIRNRTQFPNPYPVTAAYLNQASVQRALGVDTNYTTKVNGEVLASFWSTGDYVNPKNMAQFERVLQDLPVRVALVYGDADYICNWPGGEAVSLQANHSGAAAFRRAGYTPLLVGGAHHGDVREQGNLSFTRMFDAGHMVPWWKPRASLALFNRTINGWDLATGERRAGPEFATAGEPVSLFSQKVERERTQAERRMVGSAKFRAV
jgi:carboxypeptidase C (cathepsin A)